MKIWSFHGVLLIQNGRQALLGHKSDAVTPFAADNIRMEEIENALRAGILDLTMQPDGSVIATLVLDAVVQNVCVEPDGTVAVIHVGGLG